MAIYDWMIVVDHDKLLTGIDPPFEVLQIPVDCLGWTNDFDFLPKGIDQFDNEDFDFPSRTLIRV